MLRKTLLLLGSTLALHLMVSGCGPSQSAKAPEASGAEEPMASGSEASTGSEAKTPPTDTAAVGAVSLEDRAALIQVWSQFAEDWNSKDPQRLSRWNAAQGVFLLDNPGAFVRVVLYEGLAQLLALPGEYDGARIKSITLNETVDEGPLPSVSCEDPEGLPPGVFLGATDASFVTTYVEAMEEYQLAPKDEAARLLEVEKGYAGFKKFLVHDTRANVSFLFAIAQGETVIVAVNAVIPCSA